jgi:hypothetical protein
MGVTATITIITITTITTIATIATTPIIVVDVAPCHDSARHDSAVAARVLGWVDGPLPVIIVAVAFVVLGIEQ